jgi:hypothetical protein
VGSQARLDLPGAPDRLSHQPIRRYYCAFNTFSIMFQNMLGISAWHRISACHM